MREEQIANGVKFLVHPKVKTAPLSQRISFLENKVKQQAVASELSKEVACPEMHTKTDLIYVAPRASSQVCHKP